MRIFLNWFKRLFGYGSAVVVPQPIKSDVVVSPTPEGTTTPGIITGDIMGAIGSEASMIFQAINYVRTVISSPHFKPAIMRANFTNTNGLTNEQIYDLYTKTSMTVNVHLFTGTYMQNYVWHTQGYEEGDGYVHANRYFIQDSLNMGSLILHELSHEPLGFHHDYSTEYTSVPYHMNQIFLDVMELHGVTV